VTELAAVVHQLAPQSAGLVAFAGALVYIARLIRTDGKGAREQRESIQRFGRRLGKVTKALPVLEARCWQLEEALRREGVSIPSWPHGTVAGDADDDDEDDDTRTGALPADYSSGYYSRLRRSEDA
jgi:hypothetical protein